MAMSVSSAVDQKPAVLGGPPLRKEPFAQWPVIDGSMEAALLEVLESGHWGIGSKHIDEFERRFADFVGVKHCGSCVNGTEAITVALRALGIQQGDEVLTSPYTFIGTITPIMELGAIPRFVDISEQDYLIDPDKIEDEVNENTKAIIPVHVAGCPVNMDRILEIAKKHDLKVIEDSAQAHGAEWRGNRVGSIGDLGTFSFQASKNMSAGEGGAVTTDSDDLGLRVFGAKNCGRVPEGKWYGHEVYGTNLRLSAFQAALLNVQIDLIDQQNELRHENAVYLKSLVDEIDGIEAIAVNPKGVTRHAHHLVLFRYDQRKFGDLHRDQFVQACQAEGITIDEGYVPIYTQGAVKEYASWPFIEPVLRKRGINYRAMRFPVAERITGKEGMWIHQHLLMGSRSDMDSIAEAFLKIQRHGGEIAKALV